jgi:hypothetical protein
MMLGLELSCFDCHLVLDFGEQISLGHRSEGVGVKESTEWTPG